MCHIVYIFSLVDAHIKCSQSFNECANNPCEPKAQAALNAHFQDNEDNDSEYP